MTIKKTKLDKIYRNRRSFSLKIDEEYGYDISVVVFINCYENKTDFSLNVGLRYRQYNILISHQKYQGGNKRNLCRKSIQNFIDKKGRPPTYLELCKDPDLPFPNTLFNTFELNSLSELYEQFFNTPNPLDLIENVFLMHSESKNVKTIYIRTNTISKLTNLSPHQVGYHMRRCKLQNSFVGYNISVYASKGYNTTYKVEKIPEVKNVSNC